MNYFFGTGNAVIANRDCGRFFANKYCSCLVSFSAGTDNVVLNIYIVCFATNVETVRNCNHPVIFDNIIRKGVTVTAILFGFVPKQYPIHPIFKNPIIFKRIVGILVSNRNPFTLISIYRIIPENTILNSPAKIYSILFVIMAQTVFNNRMI